MTTRSLLLTLMIIVLAAVGPPPTPTQNGGVGTSTSPTAGQVPVGQSNGQGRWQDPSAIGVRTAFPSGGLILWAANEGNDNNNCLTLATACRLAQTAINKGMAGYDGKSGGDALQDLDINLAPGETFSECVQVKGQPVGNVFVTIHGSGAQSTLTCPGGGNTLTAVFYGHLRIKNLILQGSPTGWCLGAQDHSYVQIIDTTVTFGDCGATGAQIDVSRNSTLESLSGYAISGGGVSHLHAHESGVIAIDATTITFLGTNPITYSAYFAGASFGRINAIDTTYVNAGIVHGPRFTLNRLGSIRTVAQGEGSLTTLPGDVAGNVVSNGVYDGYGNGGLTVRVSTSNAVDATSVTDALVIRDAYNGGARSQLLPDCTATGPWRLFTIKDGLGNANIAPITISAPTSLIDGAPSYSLNTAWGAVSLFCDGISAWTITADVKAGPVTLGSGATEISHTGNIQEHVFATVNIPPMTPIERLQIVGTWSFTGSTNAKSMRARLGDIGGTAFITATTANAANINFNDCKTVANRNATNSQVSTSATVGCGELGFGTTPLITSSIDTSVPTTVVFTGQLTDPTETISLESYEVILLP